MYPDKCARFQFRAFAFFLISAIQFFSPSRRLQSLPIFLGAVRLLPLHDILLHLFRNVYGRRVSAPGRSHGDWGAVLAWRNERGARGIPWRAPERKKPDEVMMGKLMATYLDIFSVRGDAMPHHSYALNIPYHIIEHLFRRVKIES